MHLVCAGTDGVVTAEDVLAAGAILDAAARDPAAGEDDLDPVARAAREAFRRLAAEHRGDLPAAIGRDFATSRGGSNLVALGMEADLGRCARIDAIDLVPRLDRGSGELRPVAAGPGPADGARE
ncbi:MAG: 2-phosphosulfolactate phosphatase [Planctomycetaceae bacterium]